MKLNPNPPRAPFAKGEFRRRLLNPSFEKSGVLGSISVNGLLEGIDDSERFKSQEVTVRGDQFRHAMFQAKGGDMRVMD